MRQTCCAAYRCSPTGRPNESGRLDENRDSRAWLLGRGTAPGRSSVNPYRNGLLVAAILVPVAAAGLWLGYGALTTPAVPLADRVEVKLPPEPAERPPSFGMAAPGSAAQLLVPVPDPALVETSATGPLPVIAKDGRQPWQVYSRPFDRADKRPRIAVVITGMGLDGDLTTQAIERLPPAVTLSFDPYARQLAQQTNAARQAGHEILLDLPMEPTDYPRQDPGPATLLTSLDDGQNIARLNWVLGRAAGYVGVTGLSGSRFTSARQSIQPILVALKQRGLMFIDSRASEQSIAASLARSLGVPWAMNDRLLDSEPSQDGVDKALANLEERARRDGAALGIGTPYPVTLERIAAWVPTLAGKGLVLAPSTAVANSQPPPTVAVQ